MNLFLKKNFFSYKSPIFIIIMFLGNLFFYTAVNAITAGPVIIDITAKPGDTIEQALYLTNDENIPLYLTIDIQDYILDEDTNNRNYSASPTEKGCKSWITTETEAQLADPGETREFKLIIKIPETTLNGQYYTAIFSSTKNASQDGPVPQIGVVGRVLSDLTINVDNTFVTEAPVDNEIKEIPFVSSFETKLFVLAIAILVIAIVLYKILKR